MLMIILLLSTLQIKFNLCALVIDKWEQNGLNYEEYCPKMKYCPEGSHVMCMYYDANQTTAAGPKCNGFKNMSMSYKVAEKLIDLVNEIRGRTAMGIETGLNGVQLPKAYGLAKLKWDNELATFAQVLANTCMFKKDTCRATARFQDPGQLVSAIRFTVPDWYPVDHPSRFAKPGLTEEKLEYAAKEGVKAWYTMKQFIPPELINTLSKSHGQGDGHTKITNQQLRYLQLIQGDMTHIGCGLSAYEEYVYNINPICNTIHIVCNFSTRPKKTTTVYRTVNPYDDSLGGHFSKCGCPEGTKEDDLCLCSPVPAAFRSPAISSAPIAPPEEKPETCDNENCQPAVVLLPIFTVDDPKGQSRHEPLARYGYEDIVPNTDTARSGAENSNGPPYNLGYFKDYTRYRRKELGPGMDPTEDHRPTYTAKSVGAPYTTKKIPFIENQYTQGKSITSPQFPEPGSSLSRTGFAINEPDSGNKNQIADSHTLTEFLPNLFPPSIGSSGYKPGFSSNDPRIFSQSLSGYISPKSSPLNTSFPEYAQRSITNNQMNSLPSSPGFSDDTIPLDFKDSLANTRRLYDAKQPIQFPKTQKIKQSIFSKVPKFSLTRTQVFPKKDVIPRKDFSQAQQLVNLYMTQKAQQNPLIALTKVTPGPYNIDDLDQQTNALINPSDDPIENAFKTEDVTKLNEKFDDKLMKLLDTLEQEVKHIELGANEKEYFDARIRKIYGTVLGKEPVFTGDPPNTDTTPDDTYDLEYLDDPNKKTIDKEMYATEDRVNELSSSEHSVYDNIPDPQHLKSPLDIIHSISTKHSDGYTKDRYRKPKNNHRLDSKTRARYKDRTKIKRVYKDFIDLTKMRPEAKKKKSFPRKKPRIRYYENRYHQYKDDDDSGKNLNKLDGYKISEFDGSRPRNYYHEKEKPRKYKNDDYDTDDGSDVDPLTYERRKYYQKKIDNLKKPLSNRKFEHERVRARRLMHGHDFEDRIRPMEPDSPPFYRPDRADRAKFLHR